MPPDHQVASRVHTGIGSADKHDLDSSDDLLTGPSNRALCTCFNNISCILQRGSNSTHHRYLHTCLDLHQ